MITARVEQRPKIVIEMDEADYKDLVVNEAYPPLAFVNANSVLTEVVQGESVHHSDRILGFTFNGLLKLRRALHAAGIIQ